MRYIVAFRMEQGGLQSVTFVSQVEAVAVRACLLQECDAVDAWIVELDDNTPDALILSAGLIPAERLVI